MKIILDTDMHTDCDDAGAMAVMHALADLGECEILAVMVSTKDPWAAPTVDAINTYRGRPGIPIGAVKGKGVLRSSKYTKQVAATCPHDLKSSDEAPDALPLYAQTLASQPDRSVVLVTVGYLTHVSRLMQLPASTNHPSGMDLIRTKLRSWVCMGGNFIGSPARDDLKLGNVNFTYDAEATLHAIRQWPAEVPLVFVGREVSSVPSGLAIGSSLAKTPPDNPVRIAYEHYFGGQARDRHVADLAAILYAVRGTRDCWDLSPSGWMDIHPDMTFEWKPAEPKGESAPTSSPDQQHGSNQRYLLKKLLPDGKANDRYVESVLDALLTQEKNARQ